MDEANEAVTVIITRVVRAGSEAAFENALRAFIPKSIAFPGHLGVHMLRPPPGGHEYGAVVKFRSRQDWEAFLRSPEYAAFLRGIEAYLEGPQQVETLCGLESWFTPLGARMTQVPPRWKMAFVTYIGVCLMVYAVSLALSWPGVEWPAWLRFFLGNALVVVGLAWAVMPVLNRVCRPWLHPVAPADGGLHERR
jgi:antibiotic biosynthesis monooxygenase (ABM) superfamily enzyme